MADNTSVRRLADALSAPTGRKPANDWGSLDGLTSPGLYAWFVDDHGADDLAKALGESVAPGLIYAGQAGAGSSTATLGSRIRSNHLGGNIYASTLRLTLAAALGEALRLEPVGGRRMTKPSEDRLSEWMLEHLSLAIAPLANRVDLGHVESDVLTILDPCLNLSKVLPTPLRGKLSTRRRIYTSPPAASRPDAAPLVGGMARVPARKGPPAGGMTPEELARELGLPNAKVIRGFLRATYPRDPALLGSSWGPLAPELEQAVRRRFGGRA